MYWGTNCMLSTEKLHKFFKYLWKKARSGPGLGVLIDIEHGLSLFSILLIGGPYCGVMLSYIQYGIMTMSRLTQFGKTRVFCFLKLILPAFAAATEGGGDRQGLVIPDRTGTDPDPQHCC